MEDGIGDGDGHGGDGDGIGELDALAKEERSIAHPVATARCRANSVKLAWDPVRLLSSRGAAVEGSLVPRDELPGAAPGDKFRGAEGLHR